MSQKAEVLTGPLTVLVEFEIRSEATTMSQWFDVWSARSLDALTHEPETTAYEAAQSEEHERQVLIFERYARGQSSIDTHQQRAAHTQLQETMGARNMTKRRVMTSLFCDIDHYGWWSRPERTETLRVSGLRLTVIVTRFPDEATKARYIKLTGDHAI